MKRIVYRAVAISGLFIAASALAQTQQADSEREQSESASENADAVVTGKREKITDRKHPDYVRCKSERVMGSLAKRKRTCMTNRQWEQAARDGNDLSREFMRQNQDGFMLQRQ